jgi:aspartate carbamoyltransferase catalytic subunit
MLKNRNLIAPSDFSLEELDEVLSLAERIVQQPSDYANACNGKILASLFYEPSTRTKYSAAACWVFPTRTHPARQRVKP